MSHYILSMSSHIGFNEGTEYATGIVNCSCGKVFSYDRDITAQDRRFPFLTHDAINTAAEDFVLDRALNLFELHTLGRV